MLAIVDTSTTDYRIHWLGVRRSPPYHNSWSLNRITDGHVEGHLKKIVLAWLLYRRHGVNTYIEERSNHEKMHPYFKKNEVKIGHTIFRALDIWQPNKRKPEHKKYAARIMRTLTCLQQPKGRTPYDKWTFDEFFRRNGNRITLNNVIIPDRGIAFLKLDTIAKTPPLEHALNRCRNGLVELPQEHLMEFALSFQLESKLLSAEEIDLCILAYTKSLTKPLNLDQKQSKSTGYYPPVPTHFVGRIRELKELRLRLSRHESEGENGNTQVLTAVKGWPGVGKTTLATVLAHDPEIAERYPDGVLWVALGERPILNLELSNWLKALGAPAQSTNLDSNELSMQLQHLLRDKRMLLIIDDVWQIAHARTFQVGGKYCATLLTTRLPSIADVVAYTQSNIFTLGILSDRESLTLLRELVPIVVEQFPEECNELINQLEGLPLAIQVAGRLLRAEIRCGFSIKDLLQSLFEEKKLLEAEAPFDHLDTKNGNIPTVSALMKKSTDLLEETAQSYFASMGAFAAKPATFDREALKSVWEVNDPDKWIRLFVQRGLLEHLPDSQRYQMHALLAAHARSLCESTDL